MKAPKIGWKNNNLIAGRNQRHEAAKGERRAKTQEWAGGKSKDVDRKLK